MIKQELELGKFYQYPFSSTLYPLVEEKGEWKAIKANTPFVLLDVMIPEGFTGEVLKVLTKDGTIGFIGFSKDFIKKTIMPRRKPTTKKIPRLTSVEEAMENV